MNDRKKIITISREFGSGGRLIGKTSCGEDGCSVLRQGAAGQDR